MIDLIMRLVWWRGEYVVLGRNAAMKIMLEKSSL